MSANLHALQPIETTYRGYRFRSRLEARWAVFFDAMKIEWDYEVEGYELGDGLRYLPDFLLAGSVFVEIKPRAYMSLVEKGDPTFLHDFARWQRLVLQSERMLLVCHGSPGEWLSDPQRPHAGFWLDSYGEKGFGFAFGECRRCTRLAAYSTTGHEGHYSLFGCETSCKCERWPIRGDALDAAIASARGARFDHGETPKVIAHV